MFRPWPCWCAVGVVPAAGTVCLLFVCGSRYHYFIKLFCEGLKRIGICVFTVAILCVRYLKMVRSQQIGGKRAGKKRRKSLKKITLEAVRPSPPGVVEFKCELRSDVSGLTVIQTVTRRESDSYQDGAPFFEKGCYCARRQSHSCNTICCYQGDAVCFVHYPSLEYQAYRWGI